MSDVNVTGEGSAPSSSPAPATSGAPAPATSATPQAAPPAQATPSNQPPEGYVPSYRLRETTERLNQYQQTAQQREAELTAKYNEMERKFQALAGIQPPPDPNVSAVRNQFGQLYPGLSKLEERAADVERLIERAGDLENQTQHYWQSYGRQTMDRLFSKASEALGTLNDEGKRNLHSLFVGYVQSSPEITARYANDPTIVDDFWKQFTSNYIDPVRRSVAAGVQQRAPGAMPQDTPGGAPRATPAPQPKTMDERVNAAWAQYNLPKG